MKEFPECVNITIFIDACYSGRMISTLDDLRKDHSKVIIMTSCGSNEETPSGNIKDSATEDFMEGAGKDYDNDGKKGDIYDRFKEMERQASQIGNNAKLSKDPRYKSCCILD